MSDSCPICGDDSPHMHGGGDDTHSVDAPDVVTVDGAEVTMLWDRGETRLLFSGGGEEGSFLIVTQDSGTQRIYEGDEAWFQLAHRLRDMEGAA